MPHMDDIAQNTLDFFVNRSTFFLIQSTLHLDNKSCQAEQTTDVRALQARQAFLLVITALSMFSLELHSYPKQQALP